MSETLRPLISIMKLSLSPHGSRSHNSVRHLPRRQKPALRHSILCDESRGNYLLRERGGLPPS